MLHRKLFSEQVHRWGREIATGTINCLLAGRGSLSHTHSLLLAQWLNSGQITINQLSAGHAFKSLSLSADAMASLLIMKTRTLGHGVTLARAHYPRIYTVFRGESVGRFTRDTISMSKSALRPWFSASVIASAPSDAYMWARAAISAHGMCV